MKKLLIGLLLITPALVFAQPGKPAKAARADTVIATYVMKEGSHSVQTMNDTLGFDFTRTQFDAEILKYVARQDTNTWLPSWARILALHYLLPADSNGNMKRADSLWMFTYMKALIAAITSYDSATALAYLKYLDGLKLAIGDSSTYLTPSDAAVLLAPKMAYADTAQDWAVTKTRLDLLLAGYAPLNLPTLDSATLTGVTTASAVAVGGATGDSALTSTDGHFTENVRVDGRIPTVRVDSILGNPTSDYLVMRSSTDAIPSLPNGIDMQVHNGSSWISAMILRGYSGYSYVGVQSLKFDFLSGNANFNTYNATNIGSLQVNGSAAFGTTTPYHQQSIRTTGTDGWNLFHGTNTNATNAATERDTAAIFHFWDGTKWLIIRTTATGVRDTVLFASEARTAYQPKVPGTGQENYVPKWSAVANGPVWRPDSVGAGGSGISAETAAGMIHDTVEVVRGRMAVNARNFGALGNGIADDRPALQAALDTAYARGVACYIPAGTYLLSERTGPDSADLNLSPGAYVFGDGDKTILQRGYGAKDTVAYCMSFYSTRLKADSSLNNYTIRDLQIRGATGGKHRGIESDGTGGDGGIFLGSGARKPINKVIIENVTVRDTKKEAITVWDADQVRVTGCHVYNVNFDAYNLAYVRNLICTGNFADSVEYALEFVGRRAYSTTLDSVATAVIANNEFVNVYEYGINIAGGMDVLVKGNILRAPAKWDTSWTDQAIGVFIQPTPDYGLMGTLVIDGNIIEGFYTAGIGTSNYGADDVPIDRIIIRNNTIYRTGACAISISAPDSTKIGRIDIVNNAIYDWNQRTDLATSYNYAGIYLNWTDTVLIMGNRVANETGNSRREPVFFQNTTGTQIVYNDFRCSRDNELNIMYAPADNSDFQIYGNIGLYRPRDYTTTTNHLQNDWQSIIDTTGFESADSTYHLLGVHAGKVYKVKGGTGSYQPLDADLTDLSDGSLTPSKVPTFSAGSVGVVPASGGGTTNYLRADGNWAAPPGGSGLDSATVQALIGDSMATLTDLDTTGAAGKTATTSKLWFDPSDGKVKVATDQNVGTEAQVRMSADTVMLYSAQIGIGMATDTALFRQSYKYPSFKVDGTDTLVITKIIGTVQGSSPDVDVKLYFDANQYDATPTEVNSTALTVTSTTTGSETTTIANPKIPPGTHLWMGLTETTAQPTVLSVQAYGYRAKVR